MAEAENGDLYLVYGVTEGFHQNIEMVVLNGETLEVQQTIPVAMGGGHKDRVNINARPALAFDARNNLWISYENNRNTSRPEDGDNYTGDRCCALLSYQEGKIVEGWEGVLGDVVISVPTADRRRGGVVRERIIGTLEESEGEWGLYEELVYLLIHGVLHLIGYDHLEEKEAAQMEARERELFREIGTHRPD